MQNAASFPIATLLATVSCGICVAQSPAGDDVAAIIAQERRALDEWSKGNPTGYLAIQSDDITYFDDIRASNLIVGKEAMKSYMESLVGVIPPHSYEVIDPHVQLYDDIGILTLHYQGTSPEGEKGPLWKATSVYQKEGDEWLSVHANWSFVKTGDE